MPSLKPLPNCMISDIDLFLELSRGTCISVYAEAEKIRRKWEEQNVALEDVVAVLVERCGQHAVAMSFDRRDELDALIEDPAEDVRERRAT